jgi:hypothetical protein
MELTDLQPEDILNKSESEVFALIGAMINRYQNDIKPKFFSLELFWRELNYLVSLDYNATLEDK